jgi:glutamine amidotransferase
MMARPTVTVLDYGSGNLRSAYRAVARAGGDVTVTADLNAATSADGLIVPGVGAFAACMAGIDALDLGPVITARVAAGRPVLGICVGMQILFEYGEEAPATTSSERSESRERDRRVVTKGLGLLPGGVTRLDAERVPHMGWNTVAAPADSLLFNGIEPATRFYFVHSYAAHTGEALSAAGARVATTVHGGEFVAAVECGPVAATQFHPEKSGDAGAALLRNWIGWLRTGRQ